MGINTLQSDVSKGAKLKVESKLDLKRHTEGNTILDIVRLSSSQVKLNTHLRKSASASKQSCLNKRPQVSVQSKESKNRPGTGWLTSCTDKDPKERRNFWNIEKDLITLYLSENLSLFYKQIPLSRIVDVKQGDDLGKFKIVLSREELTVGTDQKVLSKDPTIMKRWYNVVKKGHLEAKRLKLGTGLTDKTTSPKEVKPRGIFDGKQFVLDLCDVTFDAKKQLRQLVTSNGGQISYIITSNTNFLVTRHDCLEGNPATYKHRRAVASGIAVISEEFVRDCIRKGKILSTPDRRTGKNAENFSEGKIALPMKKPGNKKAEKFYLSRVTKHKIDGDDYPDFPEEFQVPRFSILQSNSMSTKVVVVEAHIAKSDGTDDSSDFCRVMVSSKVSGEKTIRYVYPVESVADLACCYEALVKQYVSEGMRRTPAVPDAEYSGVPSEALVLILSEMKSSAGIVCPEVLTLVETVWTDSLGAMKLSGIDPEDVTVDQVRNAMIVLLKIEEALKKDCFKAKLSEEFYKYVKENDKCLIDSIQKVAKKRQVCQLLKDIVSLNENSWLNTKMDAPACQYSALKCAIVWLDQNCREFKTVKDLFPDQTSGIKYDIQNIFRINRNSELCDFRRDLKNRKLLFHASSASNFVSILSKGLVMPGTATSELGISRRDEGRLGSGIYFSDSFEMSAEFSTVSPSRGTRRILVNEVALGKVFETKDPTPDLVESPLGFQSVKGIGTDAKGHEYAVYNTNQQRMRYIVEFSLEDERVTEYDRRPLSLPLPNSLPLGASENTKTMESMDPFVQELEHGLLVDGKKDCAKLEEVHVRGKIIDLVSEVTLFQAYKSTASKPVEAKYVFPLTDNAAVCGFEAFINEKHVIAEVKEKEEAHREYKKAVAEGHGAYLMDEERPNVFTVSVGNIPPRARVVIKITYIVELETVNDPESCVLFTLPGSIASWDEDSVLLDGSVTQSTTKSVKVNSASDKSSILLSVDMPFDILDIFSESHRIVAKKTATKACVKLQKSEGLSGKRFRLLIKVAEIHVPRIWIEEDKSSVGDQVAMATFFPEFDFDVTEDFDCTILLDASNSMAGPTFGYAKYITSLLISHLPGKCKFKVLAFGSNFEENFIDFQNVSSEANASAKKFVNSCNAERGGTDLLYFLNSTQLMLKDASSQRMHNIFLVSDGHLSEQDRTLATANQICKKSFSQTRIFTLGVGNSPDSHMLQSLSVSTGGRYEHFWPSIRRTWRTQVGAQVSFARQPALTDVWFEWSNYESVPQPGEKEVILHVPEKVKCVFSGSRLTAYSFLPRCTKVTLHAKICGNEFSTVVMAHALSKITGRTLHRLAAKAVFKEYESGRLADDSYVDQVLRDARKSSIIALSIKQSVVSKFTSFVAVEKRKENEDMSLASGPVMSELLQAAFTDLISEVSWGFEGKSVDERFDEALKRSAQMHASSIVRAREFALEAKSLYDTLDKPDFTRKILLSAALCELDIVPDGFDPYRELKDTLLDGNQPNYDLLNSLCRRNDSSVTEALQTLSGSFWPDYCSVQLTALPEKLRPLAVGAFVACCQANEQLRKGRKPFLVDTKLVGSFWETLRRIRFEKEGEITGRVMAEIKQIVVRMLYSFQHDYVEIRTESANIFKSAPLGANIFKSAPLGRAGHSTTFTFNDKVEAGSVLVDAASSSSSLFGRSNMAAPILCSMSFQHNMRPQQMQLQWQMQAVGQSAYQAQAQESVKLQSKALFRSSKFKTKLCTTASPELEPSILKAAQKATGFSFGSDRSMTAQADVFGQSAYNKAQRPVKYLQSFCLNSMAAAPSDPTFFSSNKVTTMVGGGLFGSSPAAVPDTSPQLSSMADQSYRTMLKKADFRPESTIPVLSCQQNQPLFTHRAHKGLGRMAMNNSERQQKLLGISGNMPLQSTHGFGPRAPPPQPPAIGGQAPPLPTISGGQAPLSSAFFGGQAPPPPPPTIFGEQAPPLPPTIFGEQDLFPPPAIFGGQAPPPRFDSLFPRELSSPPLSVPRRHLQSRKSEFACLLPVEQSAADYLASPAQQLNSDRPITAVRLETDGADYISNSMTLQVQQKRPLLASRPASMQFGKLASEKMDAGQVERGILVHEGQMMCANVSSFDESAAESCLSKIKTKKKVSFPEEKRKSNFRKDSAEETFLDAELNDTQSDFDAIYDDTWEEPFTYGEGADEEHFTDALGAFHLCSLPMESSAELAEAMLETDDDLVMWSSCDSEEERTTSTNSETRSLEARTQNDALLSLVRLISASAHDDDEAVTQILNRIHDAGFWKFSTLEEMVEKKFSDREKQLLAICKDILVDSGARSLGAACFSSALDMLLTAIVIEILEYVLKLEDDQSRTTDLCQRMSWAKKWLKDAEAIHPLLYTRLELGSSWKAAANAVIASVVTKFQRN